MREPLQPLHGPVVSDGRQQGFVVRITGKIDGPVLIKEGIVSFIVHGVAHHQNTPQQGIERRWNGHDPVIGDVVPGQGFPGHVAHMALHTDAPHQIKAADRQAHKADNVARVFCAGHEKCRQDPDEQRQGIGRIDNEQGGPHHRRYTERPQHLSAVYREAVQQDMRDKGDKHHKIHPGPVPGPFRVPLYDEHHHERCQQRQHQQGMTCAAVVSEIFHGISQADQHIQIRQQAADTAPHQGRPADFPSQHRLSDSGSQRDLCHGIQ